MKKLSPAAFMPNTNLMATVYYIAFPDSWRDILFEIEELRRGKPFSYNLPTNTLDKLLISWLPEVVSCSAIGQSKDNSKWLVTCEPVQQERLAEFIKIWIANEYIYNKKYMNVTARDRAKDFYRTIKLSELCSSDSVELMLFEKDGTTACSETFRVLPLQIMRRLMGKNIELGGRNIKFLSAGKNVLLTEPIEVICNKQKVYFSIALEFSVQTIPPTRQAMLIYHLKVRRWVMRPSKSWDFKVENDTTKAYIRVAKDKMQEIRFTFDRINKVLLWDEMDKNGYEGGWIHNQLCDINEIIKAPVDYIKQEKNSIMLTYRYALDKNVKYVHKVKPGLPMADRLHIQNWLSQQLSGLVEETEVVQQVKRQLSGLDVDSIKDTDRTLFRRRMAQAIGGQKLALEVYCHDHSEIGLKVLKQLKEDFGLQNECGSFPELEVTVSMKSLGEIDAPLDKNIGPLQRFERRIDEISKAYGRSPILPTACIIVLPGKDDFGDENIDPKKAIRAGFALTGRLTQFIMPAADQENQHEEDETTSANSEVHRIYSAIYDLYRQLGYLMPLKASVSVKEADYSVPVMAIWVVNYKKTMYGNVSKIPVFVRTDFIKGQIRVDCDYFTRPNLLYWEACLEFQKIPGNKDIRNLMQTNLYAPIKRKMLELYNIQKEPILVLVKADGASRSIFKMISDSELAKTERTGPYTISKLWFDNSEESGIILDKRENGLRIIRIRGNDEVPDYTTGINLQGNAETRSGLFKYKDVYWSIAQRPNDKLYKNMALVKSKILRPDKECKSPDMLELFPIHLKSNDNPEAWAYLTHQLRKAAHQYKETLRMPLPLHLAQKLEEYMG